MCSSCKMIRWWTKLRMKVRLNRESTWSGNGKMLNRRVEESWALSSSSCVIKADAGTCKTHITINSNRTFIFLHLLSHCTLIHPWWNVWCDWFLDTLVTHPQTISVTDQKHNKHSDRARGNGEVQHLVLILKSEALTTMHTSCHNAKVYTTCTSHYIMIFKYLFYFTVFTHSLDYICNHNA